MLLYAVRCSGGLRNHIARVIRLFRWIAVWAITTKTVVLYGYKKRGNNTLRRQLYYSAYSMQLYSIIITGDPERIRPTCDTLQLVKLATVQLGRVRIKSGGWCSRQVLLVFAKIWLRWQYS